MQKKFSNLKDELVIEKMKKISEEVKQGKINIFSEKEVKQKYNFK